METWDRSRGKRAIFIGSSVCVGEGASDNYGWSARVAERMRRNGWSCSNCAIGGQRTADILARVWRDVIVHEPAVCFVGLGLANEGLITAEDPMLPYYVFLGNLKDLVDRLHQAGIFVILGGVYPNGEITPERYELVLSADRIMDTWGVPVLHWLKAMATPEGRFLPGLMHDPYHPNDAGYARMAAQVPESVWTLLECPQL